MSKIIRLIFYLLLLCAVGIATQTYSQESQPALFWRQKVAPQLFLLESEQRIDFILAIDSDVDLTAADKLANKAEKGAFVYGTLTKLAQTSQAPIVAEIEARELPYRQFWINNTILVTGTQADIEYFAQMGEITAVFANPITTLDLPPILFHPAQEVVAVDKIEPNIKQIGAPDVWELGITGQGVVIGGQDTGYHWQHPALINQYRGWDGAEADHDYNWHDTVTSDDNGVCGSNSPEPCDDFSSSHGTHTMGTAVGTDGGHHQIGVAPDAQWIGCRNMNNGNGTPATYTECYEWFIAPYPLGGDPFTDGDPSKAPHIITNSWGCPPSEGCAETSLLKVVQAVRAAGILSVHSAGNTGANCGTISTPATHFQESFSVGSVDGKNVISSFSGRGPATVGVESWRKPDIVAPGDFIRSASKKTGYNFLSGTSMAAPHVAGVAALLISAEPSLAGQVDLLEQILAETAVPLTSAQGCGGDSPTQTPNNVYGNGRVDALAAVSSILFDEYQSYLPTILRETGE